MGTVIGVFINWLSVYISIGMGLLTIGIGGTLSLIISKMYFAKLSN